MQAAVMLDEGDGDKLPSVQKISNSEFTRRGIKRTHTKAIIADVVSVGVCHGFPAAMQPKSLKQPLIACQSAVCPNCPFAALGLDTKDAGRSRLSAVR